MKVVVDDSSSRINYVGKWLPTTSHSQPPQGSPPPPPPSGTNGTSIPPPALVGSSYNRTLSCATAAVNGTASGTTMLSFGFGGKSVQVFGTPLPSSASSSSGSSPSSPTWTCSVDGKSIDTYIPSSSSPTNDTFILCDTSIHPISPGHHTLTLALTKVGGGLCVDDITYEPLANASSTSSPMQSIMLDSTDVDAGFVSSNGWTVDSGSVFVSKTAGAEMTVKFYGTSIAMYGLPTAAKTDSMMYIIDGSSPASIPILAKRQPQSQSQSPATVASANSNTFANTTPSTGTTTKIIPNQILFQSPTFSPGPHTFSFNVTSASTSSPFSVSYFIIDTPSLSDTLSFNPSTMSSSPSSPSGSVIPSSTMSGAIETGSPISTLEHSGHSMIGKVAGGVIGALVIVGLIGGLVGWMWWKKKGLFASRKGNKEYAMRDGNPRAYYVSHGGSYGQQTHTKNSSGGTTGSVVDSPVVDKKVGMGVVVNGNDTKEDKVIAFPSMDHHAPAPPPIPVLLSSSSPSLSASHASAGSLRDMSASASAVASTVLSDAATAKRQSSYGSSMTKEERRRSMSMRKAPPQLTDEEEVPPLPVPSVPASTGATPAPSPRASVVQLPAVGAAGHTGKLGMLVNTTTPSGSPAILMPDLPLDQQSLSRVSTPSHGHGR